MNSTSIEAIRNKALTRLRDHYLTIANTPARALDLRLLNRGIQPAAFRYNSATEYLVEVFATGAALSRFALELGLITVEQARAAAQEIFRVQPQLDMAQFEPVLESILSASAPDQPPSTLDDIRQTALRRVRDHYQLSLSVHQLQEAGNMPLPVEASHHSSWASYDRQVGSTAAEIGSYAVYIGLFSTEELREILWNRVESNPEVEPEIGESRSTTNTS
jgi:hypothetical protein